MKVCKDPSPEIIRAYIEQQQCWICGKGGWRALSQHLVKKHGLPASQVREMAYMLKRERLISPELSEFISKDALRRFGDKKYTKKKGEKMTPKIMSRKATDILRQRVTEIRPLAAISQRKRRGPHPCPLCGRVIETSRPLYCRGCLRIALSKAAKKNMTPERIAFFKTVRAHHTPEQQSKIAREYWERFKTLPPEEQRERNLARAASRRVRVKKNCVICGAEFECTPSAASKLVTCGKPLCARQNRSKKGTGRRHTPEAIAKMSAYAKERHISEPLFGIKAQ